MSSEQGNSSESSQQKTIWMPRDAGRLTDGQINYDSCSHGESKRGHPWLMDTTGPELFNKKRQAIEAVNNRPISGVSQMNVSPWHNAIDQSVSGQFNNSLLGSAPLQTVNVVDRNIPFNSGNMTAGRRNFNDQFGQNSTVGLSMSRTVEDPSTCSGFGGMRRVKVNQVRNSENGISAFLGHPYGRGNSNNVSMGSMSVNTSISLPPNYDNGVDDAISVGPSFRKTDGRFISIGQNLDTGDGSFRLMGHPFNKGNENTFAMCRPFDKGDGRFIAMNQPNNRGNSSVISMAPSQNNCNGNFMTMSPNYSRTDDMFNPMAPSATKGKDKVISTGTTYYQGGSRIPSTGTGQEKGRSSAPSMDQNYPNVGNTTALFGSFRDTPETNQPGSIASSYDMLIRSQISSLSPEAAMEYLAGLSTGATAKTRAESDSNKKEKKKSKKDSSNNFPTNVRSLMSTGLFDGIPVKYCSWARDKTLRGTIKGTAYLCSCSDCKYSKPLNAYEFERHAGCKTKHPNNHIFFENGKSIYAVVHELKNTPQHMLFDVIQTVTGSQINQRNFRLWKESFQAATRELQRIYGSDEAAVQSRQGIAVPS